MASKLLNVIQLNINSLRSISKRQELNTFLVEKKPDILLLNETKLNNKHKISFRNYEFIRNDRPNNNGGGGTGILIHSSITHAVLPVHNLNSMECTAISIPLSNNKNIIVVAIYVAKCMQNTIDMNDLNTILNLKNSESEIIVGGDFNAHHPLWLSNSTSPNGRAIYNWYVDCFSDQSISLIGSLYPSRHSNESHSYLDLFLVSCSLNIIYPVGFSNHLKTVPFESDHDAVLLTIALHYDTIPFEPIIINDFAHTNWTTFNQKIEDGLSNILLICDRKLTNDEIDELLLKVTELLQNTIGTEVPKTTIKQAGQIPLPKKIVLVLKYKNKLRRIWHRNKYKHTDLTLISQIKCLNIMIKKLISNHYNSYYETKLSNIRPDNNLYKNLKKFSGFKMNEKFSDSLKSGDNNQLFSPQEKVNGLGQHFENVHKRTSKQGDAEFSESIGNVIKNEFINKNINLTSFNQVKSADQSITEFHPFDNILNDPPLPYPTQQPLQIAGQINLQTNNWNYMNFSTGEEIISIIKSKNSKKSFGSDGISNYVLRKLSIKFYNCVAILFNHMLNNAYWPSGWKNGIVIPILKPSKDPTMVDSYRPITLLSCLSKVFESWILIKIRKHCDDNKILPVEQFGFRPRHSTVHALAILTHNITTAINNKIPTLACSLDCEKAFDTTWIEGLLYKLKYLFGVNNHLCQLLYNYLKNRTFQVKINNTLSDVYEIAAGVPQGSVLAPILYTLYISDLPTPDNPDIKKIVFADDILVYASTQNLLGQSFNRYLNKIHNHLDLWKIKLNLNKCEAIVFKGNCKSLPRWVSKKINKIQIKINNNTIEIKNKIKYLGLILSKNMKYFDHINYIINKTFKAFHKIKHIFYGKNRYTEKVKSILYKQLIRPILTYGFVIWHNISSAQMERLRIMERKFLRTCVNKKRKQGSYMYINNNELYSQTNTIRIDRLMVSHSKAFLESINDLDNVLINNMISEHREEYYLEESNIFKSPLHLSSLIANNNIYDGNNNLIYYHRRAFEERDHDHNNIVYNLNQGV